MNRTSAWWVIAHSDKLNRFMTSLPVRSLLPDLDGAYPQAGFERLHAERDDPLAIVDAAGDQRGVAGEGRDGDRPQRQRAVTVDDVHGRPGPAVEHGGERHTRHRRLALALEDD